MVHNTCVGLFPAFVLQSPPEWRLTQLLSGVAEAISGILNDGLLNTHRAERTFERQQCDDCEFEILVTSAVPAASGLKSTALYILHLGRLFCSTYGAFLKRCPIL